MCGVCLYMMSFMNPITLTIEFIICVKCEFSFSSHMRNNVQWIIPWRHDKSILDLSHQNQFKVSNEQLNIWQFTYILKCLTVFLFFWCHFLVFVKVHSNTSRNREYKAKQIIVWQERVQTFPSIPSQKEKLYLRSLEQ